MKNTLVSIAKKLILKYTVIFNYIATSKLYKSIMLILIKKTIKKIELDKSYILSIETTNACNAKCSFCPHGTMERKRTIMSDQMFDELLSKIDFVPVGIVLNGMGEPFTDPLMIKRIKLLRAKFPITKIKLHTNLALLNDVEELLSSGISEVNVSFNGMNKAEYESKMGINYDKSFCKLSDLLDLNRGRISIKVSCVASDYNNRREEMLSFAHLWESKGATVIFNMLTGWGGRIETEVKRDKNPLPCRHPFKTINISSNGTLFICCEDYENKFGFGILKNFATLSYAHQCYSKSIMRNSHLSCKGRDLRVCSDCNFDCLRGLDWLMPDSV